MGRKRGRPHLMPGLYVRASDIHKGRGMADIKT